MDKLEMLENMLMFDLKLLEKCDSTTANTERKILKKVLDDIKIIMEENKWL